MKSKSIAKMLISAMDSRPETFTFGTFAGITIREKITDNKTGYEIHLRTYGSPYIYMPFFQNFSVYEEFLLKRAIKRLRTNHVKEIYEPEGEKDERN